MNKSQTFEDWLDTTAQEFLYLDHGQRMSVVMKLLSLCDPKQMWCISQQLQKLLKRDFIRFLPLEISEHIFSYLSLEDLFIACRVSQTWNSTINQCSSIWKSACDKNGWLVSPGLKYDKQQYLDSVDFLESLRSDDLIETVEFSSGAENIFVLKYWDGKLVTGYYTGEVHCYEWGSQRLLKKYEGNVSAVFTIDHNQTRDVVVSGSADHTVRMWKLSTAEPLATLVGHSGWVNTLISAGDKEIKVWSLEEEQCLHTFDHISAAHDASYETKVGTFQPKITVTTRDSVLTASCKWRTYMWSLVDYTVLRKISHIFCLPSNPSTQSVCMASSSNLLLHYDVINGLCISRPHYSKETTLLWDSEELWSSHKSRIDLVLRSSNFAGGNWCKKITSGDIDFLAGFTQSRKPKGVIFACALPNRTIKVIKWKEGT